MDTITLTALKGSPHTLIKVENPNDDNSDVYKVLSYEGTEKMGYNDDLQKYVTLKGGPTLTVNKKIRGKNLLVKDIQVLWGKGLYVTLVTTK